MGKLGDDPQIKPIIKELYSGIVDNLQEMQREIGINLDELLSIPNGELALAVLPTKTIPAVCLLLEAGDELPRLRFSWDDLKIAFPIGEPSSKRRNTQGSILFHGRRLPERNVRLAISFIPVVWS